MSSLLVYRPPVEPDEARSLQATTVGATTVIHPSTGIGDEAKATALAVERDPEHELVLLDLPADSSVSFWEDAVELLPRTRRGIRLLMPGRDRESTALAGQWLAARLGCTVLVPDGRVVPGARGFLFPDPLDGRGWMRLHRRRRSVRDARRYPRPAWEVEPLSDAMPTSARTRAEPLPAGAWVHATEGPDLVEAHRERLQQSLPILPDAIILVLGCPGDDPLSLDDVARLWHAVPEQLRGQLRPVRYGPIAVPEGTTWQQALADLLGTAVVCFAGLPVGASSEPEVHTVLPDGVLGWRSRARELQWFPTGLAESGAPLVVSHHSPLPAAHEVAPRVYWYAPDAVVEIVPPGLWIRPPAEPEHARSMRSAVAEPERHLLLFDDASPEQAERLRRLAADVLAQLDDATQRLTELRPASSVAPVGTPASAPALVADVVAHPQPGAGSPFSVPQMDRVATAPISVDAPVQRDAERGAGPRIELGAPPTDGPTLVPSLSSTPVLVGAAAGSSSASTARQAIAVAAQDAPARLPASEPLASRPAITHASTRAPARAVGMQTALRSAPAAPAAVSVPAAASASVPAPASAPGAPASPLPVVEPGWALQIAPQSEASALEPADGLDRERAWMHSGLRDQFSSAASAVSRVLSENPALSDALARSGDDVLTDAVAVRLHLASATDELSGPLRRGEVGSHVPFARCVLSGLRRLPSHRGVTGIPVDGAGVPWALIAERGFLTEWGFLEGAAGALPAGAGDVDVAIWSLTSRRTRLLEPREAETPERVLFLPGTSFTVLEFQQPEGAARGRLLLRELAGAEVDADGRPVSGRTALDELAVGALHSAFSGPSIARGAPAVRPDLGAPGLVPVDDAPA